MGVVVAGADVLLAGRALALTSDATLSMVIVVPSLVAIIVPA
ncbi:hypothetical protein [Desulfitobacterium chlororespirans]|nr:hypothetical protein [Desulfitobacterium chlororespirans]